jgi:hypothetical protein
MGPPEGVLFEDLVLLEVLSYTPALVIGKSKSVLLEEGVDSWDTSVPGVLQIVEGESTILCCGFLTLECVLSPDTLRVEELRLPGLDVAVKVRDKLILLVTHACAEMSDTRICLLAKSQITLGYQNVSH